MVVKYKNSNKTSEIQINVPMIFITNSTNICGIQDTSIEPLKDINLSDEIFNILNCDFQIFNSINEEFFKEDDDDILRKGLKERLHIIVATKNIFKNGNLIEEFTTEHTKSIIKLSETVPSIRTQSSFFNTEANKTNAIDCGQNTIECPIQNNISNQRLEQSFSLDQTPLLDQETIDTLNMILKESELENTLENNQNQSELIIAAQSINLQRHDTIKKKKNKESKPKLTKPKRKKTN